MMRAAFKAKTAVEVLVECAPRAAELVLMGSPRHLRQVLKNLVGNALSVTARGHVKIVVEVLGETSDAATLALAVEDTGPGVPLQHQSAIFAEYRQVRHIKVGTGLGLPLCCGLVRLMGGMLQVTSPWRRERASPTPAEGRFSTWPPPAAAAAVTTTATTSTPNESAAGPGSKFYFTLRFPKPAKARQAAFTVSELARRTRRIKRDADLPSNWRVLIADDGAINRSLIRRKVLAIQPAWWLDEADSGELAIAMARSTRYDLLFLDEEYGSNGKLKGTEVAKMLRRIERDKKWPRAIIIGATGYQSAEHNAMALKSGQDHVFGKPYPSTELMEDKIWDVHSKALSLSGAGGGGAGGSRKLDASGAAQTKRAADAKRLAERLAYRQENDINRTRRQSERTKWEYMFQDDSDGPDDKSANVETDTNGGDTKRRAPADLPWIDMPKALELMGNDAVTLHDFLGDLRRCLDESVAKLTRAIDGKDPEARDDPKKICETVYSEAHSIKGAASNLCLPAIAQAARDVIDAVWLNDQAVRYLSSRDVATAVAPHLRKFVVQRDRFVAAFAALLRRG